MARLGTSALMSRLDAVNESQKRARLALFVSILGAGAILAGLWNLYGSWDLHWAGGISPDLWAAQQLQIQQIRSWVDNNTVGVSLLGIKLSTSDAAITGAVVLLALAVYHFLCVRRENYEVGAMLIESKAAEDDIRSLVLHRITAFMIFTSATTADAPYESLTRPNRSTVTPRPHTGVNMLTFLPAFAVLLILVSDVYWLTIFAAPWRPNDGPGAWSQMDDADWVQLAGMDTFALALGTIAFVYCRLTVRYRRGTQHMIEQYAAIPRRAQSRRREIVAKPQSHRPAPVRSHRSASV